MFSTQDQARRLATRQRQQQQHRRAAMLERSAREVLPQDMPQDLSQ